jgi:hypothetical protein
MQIGHLVFELSAFLYISRRMTLKVTFKVKEFQVNYLKSSPYEDAQINKEIAQIGSFMFELSAFLHFSRRMILKLTVKVNEFCGHLLLDDRLSVNEQNEFLAFLKV